MNVFLLENGKENEKKKEKLFHRTTTSSDVSRLTNPRVELSVPRPRPLVEGRDSRAEPAAYRVPATGNEQGSLKSFEIPAVGQHARGIDYTAT